MKTVYYLLFIINLILLSGCSSLETIHSGALNVMQTEFPDDKVSYKRISSNEINYRTFCGMNTYALNNKAETVNIFNFNGETIQTGSSGSFGAQLGTFLLNVAVTTFAFSPFINNPDDWVLALPFGLVGGAIINQALWEKHHYKNAIGISNKVMIDTDPKIDFYVNPSYSIRTQSGLFSSKHSVTANSIGIKLHDDLFTNNITIVESNDKKQDNVKIEIAGCTDDTACNFDSDAISDDGSCESVSCAGCDGVANSGLINDACGVCGGSGIPEGACDCEGNRQDALGVCGGLCAYDADGDNICDDIDDCVGVLDECGVCNGPGAVYDCGCSDMPVGDCDCNGNQLDALGVCGGPCAEDADFDGICDDVDAMGPLNFTLKDKLVYTDNKGNEYDASILFFEEDGCYKIEYKNKNGRIKRYFVCPNNYDNLRLSD